jgi:TM2 domain-containing membrane protein YozV
MKNRITAAILAFFLGGIGVHRFYLGQSGLGLLCLLFCWTFIPAVIAFIDFIIFLTMSDEAFNDKYNQGKDLVYNTGKVDVSEELEKLYNLKEKGIITQEEFDQRKRKLL